MVRDHNALGSRKRKPKARVSIVRWNLKEAGCQQEKNAGGQTPEPTNRNHIGCSCGILPVAALLEFIGFHLIKNLMSAFMSEGKATLSTELLYLPLTDEALAVQHLIAFTFTR